jgi:hypothetical protein
MKAERPEDIEVLKLPQAPNGKASTTHVHTSKMSTAEADGFLLPSRNPPRYSYFDIFPFSLLVKTLTKRGKTVKGKKGALLRAKLHRQSVTHNLPLEISLYLVGLISVGFFLSPFLNHTPELVHCRTSNPQSCRCPHNLYAPPFTTKEIH